jgi:hypothetical protein
MDITRIEEIKNHYQLSVQMIDQILQNSSGEMTESDLNKLNSSYIVLSDTISCLQELISMKSVEEN